MTVGEVTARTLAPFMSRETIDALHASLVVAIESGREYGYGTPREGLEPATLTADLMMSMCCDAVIKGWQSKQEIQREKSFDQKVGIECGVRVSSITPSKLQIVAACQGPTDSLGDMRTKVIAAVRRAVKKELK